MAQVPDFFSKSAFELVEIFEKAREPAVSETVLI
jgi:hypothetical protein